MLALAAIAAAVVVFYRRRVGELRAQGATLQRLVDDRTEALATRERLEHQLLHAQKMESVGRLAGGIAHDLNNMLTAVVGHAELMATDPALSEESRADVAEIHLAARRATDLTGQLLTFARKTKGSPRVLHVGELVQRVEKLLGRLLPEEITCTTESLEGPWMVRIDPGQLEQVVVNLAVNARDAMPTGGALRIRTRAVTLDVTVASEHPDLTPGDYVVLEVQDTGAGMSPAVLARLFEPFFTTKALGKGTGLGLAVSYGIVKQGGGHILVDSREGQGSTFFVYLPRVAVGGGDDARPNPAQATTEMSRGTERILLVEDEAAVRAVAERTLRVLGYTVVSASDGVEAIEILETSSGDFAVVLTDVRMPRLGGPELAIQVREQWPHVRIGFMSGYSEATSTGVPSTQELTMLLKPFTIAELATFVRSLLGEPPAR
jgi:two-component system cell cycle sensor histidine kinase/response regulator CckA